MNDFSALEGLRVLVVDDNIDSLELITVILEQYGIEVITATSAVEAIEAIAQSIPDILISDIAMPLEDGYSLIRKIRKLPLEQGGQIPAIALTAFLPLKRGSRCMYLSLLTPLNWLQLLRN